VLFIPGSKAWRVTRVCPGRLLADASIFISCALSLAVFNIRPSKDAATVDVEQMPGIIRLVILYIPL
jgi:hypothetical protein